MDSTVASTVPTAELETVLRLGTRVTVPGGTTIMDEAGFGREFLVVLDGSLAVSREGDEVATLGAGDIVGEIALLENSRRTATVTALSDADVLAFNRREFATVLTSARRSLRSSPPLRSPARLPEPYRLKEGECAPTPGRAAHRHA